MILRAMNCYFNMMSNSANTLPIRITKGPNRNILKGELSHFFRTICCNNLRTGAQLLHRFQVLAVNGWIIIVEAAASMQKN